MIGKAYFTWFNRTQNVCFWVQDPRYEAWQRREMMREVMDMASRDMPGLQVMQPSLGWVHKPRNQDYYQPCGEHTDGAIPAWIIWVR